MELPTAWTDTPVLRRVHRLLEAQLARQGVRARRISVRSRQAFLYDAGPEDAPAVLLLHGLGDSADTFFRVLPDLSKRGRRVLALDLLAHGRSERPARGYATIPEQVEFVRDVLAEVLPGRAVTLVGQSMGGWVASKTACAAPDSIAKLVLVASGGLHYDAVSDQRQLLAIRDAADLDALWLQSCHRVPWMLRVNRHEVARVFADEPVAGFLRDVHADAWLDPEALARLAVPVEILWGAKDGLTPTFLGERLARLIPGARLTVLPDCGHAVQYERPREFARFLEAHVPRRDAVQAFLGRMRAWAESSRA